MAVGAKLTCKVYERKITLNGELKTCERLQNKGVTQWPILKQKKSRHLIMKDLR